MSFFSLHYALVELTGWWDITMCVQGCLVWRGSWHGGSSHRNLREHTRRYRTRKNSTSTIHWRSIRPTSATRFSVFIYSNSPGGASHAEDAFKHWIIRVKWRTLRWVGFQEPAVLMFTLCLKHGLDNLVITRSNLNRFAKCFHHNKQNVKTKLQKLT